MHMEHFAEVLQFSGDFEPEEDGVVQIHERLVIGIRKDIESLVPAFFGGLPVDSPIRQRIIAAGREVGTAPSNLCGVDGASLHDAVFFLANQVINGVATAIGWEEWVLANSDNPPPTAVDLSGVGPKATFRIRQWFFGEHSETLSFDLDSRMIRKALALLEVEHNAASESIDDGRQGRLDPLTEAQQDAYDLIRDSGPLMGKEVVSKLGIGSESAFTTNYVPALKSHGIKNRRGLGYYHPDTYKPE